MVSYEKKLGSARLIMLMVGAVFFGLVLVLGSAPTVKAETTALESFTAEPAVITQSYNPAKMTMTAEIEGPRVAFQAVQQHGKGGPIPNDAPWGANVRVWDDPAEDRQPSMVVDPVTGYIWIAFQHFNGADWDIALSVSTDDGLTWNTGLIANTAVNEVNPHMTVTSTGILAIVFTDDGDTGVLDLLQSTDGGVSWGLFALPISTWWAGDIGDIQFPQVAAQSTVGLYGNGIVFVFQAWCTVPTDPVNPDCGGGAHVVIWMGTSDFTQSSVTFDLGGYFYWPWVTRQSPNNIFVDSLHPSVAWSNNAWCMAFDDEWYVPDSEWKLGWVVFAEDGTPPPVELLLSRDVSQAGIYSSFAQSGTNGVLVGTFLNATAFPGNPGNHNVGEFHTSDNWANSNGNVPLDPATTNQRAASVAIGTGATPIIHVAYYSNAIMTDWWSNDPDTTWNGPLKVSDNAGSAVNGDLATSVYISSGGAPKIAWQDNRDGNVNIYTAGYITYQFWLNSTCGGSDSTMWLLIDDIYPVQTPYTARWSPGSTHKVVAQPMMQSEGICKQCTFTQWQDGDTNREKNIVVSGSFNLTAQFSDKYRVQLDTNPGNLQITWKGTPHTAQYVTYEAPQTYAASAPSPQAGPPDQRYVFTDWSDGSTQGTRNVVVSTACLNLTANFGLEYYITIQTIPGGLDVGYDTTPLGTAPVYFWSASGVQHMLITVSPQPPSPVDTRFRFERWIGGPTTWGWNVTIPGVNTYTANFITQYLIQIRANIENPGPTVGSDIRDCDVQMPAPLMCWADANSPSSLIISTPQATAGSQYVFLWWSDGDLRQVRPIGPITGPATYVSMWSAQYRLTMVLDSNTCLGSVTPGNVWRNRSEMVNIDWVPPTGVPAGEQYRFWRWVGSGLGNYTGGSQSASVTMNDAITETAYCHHEFQITLDTSPIDLNYVIGGPGGDVMANGLRTLWWEFMSVHWFNVTQTTQGTTTTQYVFLDWSGNPNPNHPAFTVSFSTSFMANFQTQYKITLGQIPASPADLGGLACSNADCWYNEGASATVSITSPWPVGAQYTRYVFGQWSGDASGTLFSYPFSSMNAPKTATANWATEHKMTVTSLYGDPHCSNTDCWYQFGTLASISITDPFAGAAHTRYAFTGWAGDDGSGVAKPFTITMSKSMNVTANWETQYELTITSDCGGTPCGNPQGEGWYDAGTAADASVTTPATVGDKTYDFTAWTGDSTGTLNPTQVTMDAPKSVTATWTEQIKPGPSSDLMVWIILIIVIIVVVALVLFLVMRRKKPPVEEELPPEEIPPAPPMRQAPPARPAAPAPAKPAPPVQRPVAPPPQKK